jgi:hypothetical protein
MNQGGRRSRAPTSNINDKWNISTIGQVVNQASKYGPEREKMWGQ